MPCALCCKHGADLELKFARPLRQLTMAPPNVGPALSVLDWMEEALHRVWAVLEVVNEWHARDSAAAGRIQRLLELRKRRRERRGRQPAAVVAAPEAGTVAGAEGP